MLAFILRRLAGAIPLLLVTSFIVFSFLHLAPGSPEQILLGGKNVDPETLQAIRDRYRLDDPFFVQYWTWLRHAVSGNLGESIIFRDSVVSVVGPRVVPTIELAAYALLLIIGFGLALGILAGIKRRTLTDTAASGIMLVGSSISTYVSGILLITVFSVALRWFPVFGLGNGGFDRVYHLTLPAIALAIALTALVARTMRASLGQTLAQEYVETARSRGFSERRVIGKHALRNALVPVITITGLVFGFLISGAVLVEYTFGLNGLGALLIQGVRTKDFAVVQAITLLFTVAFILINLGVDLHYALVDPRVRLSAKGA
ncbi:MAG: ABC transporter permease [Actinobacteria bacterium]|nr:MAG: ABC transporter permease [Actinomycetota bacterium]